MKSSIAVCVPIWNRGDLLLASLQSLRRSLRGLDVRLYLFDNGSKSPTQRQLLKFAASEFDITKVLLPKNCGIPYVVNIFKSIISQECQFTGLTKPEYVLLMDSDAYFTRPIRPGLDILNADYRVGVVSLHDAIEHDSKETLEFRLGQKKIKAKWKENERMLALLMRREELETFDPFPTFRNRDVDWEIAKWNRLSLQVRDRRLVAIDLVVHLGQFESTWHPTGVPVSLKELDRIEKVLKVEKLLNPKRRGSMKMARKSMLRSRKA